MVTQYGMSERVGAVQLGGDDSEPFMGMRGSQPSKDFSEASAAIIDEEVAKLINAAHQEAYDVLTENREVLDELVRQLFAKETLNKAEVAEVFKNLKRRDKRPAWTGSDLRIPSTIPPVEVPAASVTPEAQETPPQAARRWPLPGRDTRLVGTSRPRGSQVNHVDQPRIEAAVREILLAIGEDPDRDGLAGTPGRWHVPTRSCSRGWRRTPPSCWRPPSTSTMKS